MKLYRIQHSINGDGPFQAKNSLEGDEYRLACDFRWNVMPEIRTFNKIVYDDIKDFDDCAHYIATESLGQLYGWFEDAILHAKDYGFHVVEIKVPRKKVKFGSQQVVYRLEDVVEVTVLEVTEKILKKAAKQFQKLIK